jgi:hypothetical protein
MTAPMTREELANRTTCFLDRSAVRRILIGQSDDVLHITELVLSDIDALPIFTAEDVRGVAQTPWATPQEVQEACAQVADRAAEADETWAAKYPDEAVKFENRAHRAKVVATSIRALIPAAPSTPSPTDAGALADCKADMYALWCDHCNVHPSACPLRKSALQETRGDEPVCWIVLAKETDNVRIWWRRKEMAEAWAKTHNAPLIPLYAHPRCADAILPAPEQSPRLDREAAIRECAEAARGPVYHEIYNGTDKGNWSKDSSYGRGRHDAADAILALLSPDTTVVPSTHQREGGK